MEIKKYALKEQYNLQGGELTAYIGEMPVDWQAAAWQRPAVIVVGGGGYAMVSKREVEPVVFQFLAKGFHVFSLCYETAPAVRYPEELLELACAVDFIRKNAEAFTVNPDEIFAVGFSAGGHLCGNLSTDYTQAVEGYGAPLDCKLTGAGLCYPVISDVYGHVGSFVNLTEPFSEEKKQATYNKIRLDEIVCERTSPAFIWSTTNDQIVPVRNAIRYADALAQKDVPFELHIYPQGEHGMSTCDKEINPEKGEYISLAAHWIGACAAFFRRFTQEKF